MRGWSILVGPPSRAGRPNKPFANPVHERAHLRKQEVYDRIGTELFVLNGHIQKVTKRHKRNKMARASRRANRGQR